MRVAQSQGGGMKTDSIFLLILGFWVFATGEGGSEPETEARTTWGAWISVLCYRDHYYNLLKARMLVQKKWIRCIDNSGISWQNHHKMRSQAGLREKLKHLGFLLLYFATYQQENLCIWLFDSYLETHLKIGMIPGMSHDFSFDPKFTTNLEDKSKLKDYRWGQMCM